MFVNLMAFYISLLEANKDYGGVEGDNCGVHAGGGHAGVSKEVIRSGERRKKKGKKPITGSDKGNRSRPKDLLPGSCFYQYTPLNALRAKILENALSVDLLPLMKRMSTPRNVDKKKQSP
ncbi:hypothetical protein LR48_Vigan10g172800 [Vigna angularis]|uniref:Uncharacterized protein n=1 Tax=Phaseolus angularis TaxID=3914 RepID=A0A0L9VL94_PHAAN|nr:hypothetical protein LR48_Vigan10g172800 [Vigna angularis]